MVLFYNKDQALSKRISQTKFLWILVVFLSKS